MKLFSRARATFRVSKGRTKKITGKITRNRQLEADGLNDQLTGRLQQVAEDVKGVLNEH